MPVAMSGSPWRVTTVKRIATHQTVAYRFFAITVAVCGQQHPPPITIAIAQLWKYFDRTFVSQPVQVPRQPKAPNRSSIIPVPGTRSSVTNLAYGIAANLLVSTPWTYTSVAVAITKSPSTTPFGGRNAHDPCASFGLQPRECVVRQPYFTETARMRHKDAEKARGSPS